LPFLASRISDDVYIAGYTSFSGSDWIACYWKNGERYDVGDPGAWSYANAVADTNLGPMIAGHQHDGLGVDRAAMWDWDGRALYLDESPSEALGISAWHGKLIVVGYRQPAAARIPCYWELEPISGGIPSGSTVFDCDVTLHELAFGGSGGTAMGICVDGDDLLICGSCNATACYWLNGSRVDLEGKGLSVAKKRDGTIYAAGTDASLHPRYWVDSVGTTLVGFPSKSTGSVYALETGPEGLCLGGMYETTTSGPFSFLWVAGTLSLKAPDLASHVIDMERVGSGRTLIKLVDLGWYEGDAYHGLPAVPNRTITLMALGN
jgi:hypothetical protein